MADISLPHEFLESKVFEEMKEEGKKESGRGGGTKRGRLEGQRVSSNIVLASRNPRLPPGVFRCFQASEVIILDKPLRGEAEAENPNRAQK